MRKQTKQHPEVTFNPPDFREFENEDEFNRRWIIEHSKFILRKMSADFRNLPSGFEHALEIWGKEVPEDELAELKRELGKAP